ncbi:hypothetical protein BM530_20945, partial [Clostridioides difficile]
YGKKYYFNTNTAEAATGWQTIDGKKYYFNTNTAIASTGYTIINGKHFYFNTDGIMQIGVFKDLMDLNILHLLIRMLTT